jgi:predicted transcriptional regulator
MAMTLRLPDDLDSDLKKQAEREEISVHALIVKATREYVDRHSKQQAVTEAVDRIKTQYADALRRLGE